MPRPGRRPGRSGGRVTSGAVVGGLLVDGALLPGPVFGGSSSPPVLPPIRPSPLVPVAEPLGSPVLVCLPEAGVWPEALGVVDRWAPEEPVVAELVPCGLPSLLWEGGGGSRDCSGATS